MDVIVVVGSLLRLARRLKASLQLTIWVAVHTVRDNGNHKSDDARAFTPTARLHSPTERAVGRS
jgi:hypothetical protein